MSDDDKTPASEHEPVRITDKREQKRAEAEAARLRREQAMTEHPTADGEEGVDLVDRAEYVATRITSLKEKGRAAQGLSEEDSSELLELQAEWNEIEQAQKPDEVVEAVTAFLVVVHHDGTVIAGNDVNLNLSIERLANVNDFYNGACVVKRDIESSKNAEHVLVAMNTQASAMRQQMATQQQMAALQRPPSQRR